MDIVSLDRLVILIVSESQANPLMKHLSREAFQFTLVQSKGTVGQEAQVCLLIGFFHNRLQTLLEIVRKNCQRASKFIPTQGVLPGEAGGLPLLEVQVGGALVYMLNVERFVQL